MKLNDYHSNIREIGCIDDLSMWRDLEEGAQMGLDQLRIICTILCIN